MSEQKQYRMADVKELALKCGFKLKQKPNGNMDLNPYVYQFAGAVAQLQINASESERNSLQEQLTTANESIEQMRDALHSCTQKAFGSDMKAKIAREALNATPATDVRSQIEKDGLPTFYISTEGTVCTHRMSDTDTPVWCRNGEDGIKAMESIQGLQRWKEMLIEDGEE